MIVLLDDDRVMPTGSEKLIIRIVRSTSDGRLVVISAEFAPSINWSTRTTLLRVGVMLGGGMLLDARVANAGFGSSPGVNRETISLALSCKGEHIKVVELSYR